MSSDPAEQANEEHQQTSAEQPPDATETLVVTPDGVRVAITTEADSEPHPAAQVESPAKVMRVGSMVKQLLEEVRSAPLDDAGRKRLATVHDVAVTELKDALAPELDAELDRLVQPFKSDAPSEGELRIAQAQLVGWLEGLFQGIQTALVAQQMAAQAQLQEMRRALPGGPGESAAPGGPGGPAGGPGTPGTGQYL